MNEDYDSYRPNEDTGHWGNGIDLNQHFDMIVDESGDVKGAFGLDEFEKDTSWRVAIKLTNELGKILTKNEKERVKIRTKEALKEDPRTTKTISLSVEERQADELFIKAHIVSSRFDEYDAVFNFQRD